jgi:arabinose-5-phosphate isomerase
MRHPSGAIGRAVSMHVKDLIRPAERTAVVEPATPVKDVLLKMTKARTGSAAILGADNKIMGIFTDGDFRRCVSDDLSVLSKPIADVMTKNPVSIQADSLAVEILKLVEKKPVDDIVVLNADGTFAGMVDIQDLPRFKVM